MRKGHNCSTKTCVTLCGNSTHNTTKIWLLIQ